MSMFKKIRNPHTGSTTEHEFKITKFIPDFNAGLIHVTIEGWPKGKAFKVTSVPTSPITIVMEDAEHVNTKAKISTRAVYQELRELDKDGKAKYEWGADDVGHDD